MTKELESKYNDIMEMGKKQPDEAYLPEKSDDFEPETEEKPEEKIEEEAGIEEKSELEGEEDKYEDIPDNLVEAGRKRGLTDETIVSLAEDHPEVLEKLAETIPAAEPQRVEKPQEPEERKKPEQLEHIKSDDMGELDPVAQKVVKNLVSGQNKLIDRFNVVNEQLYEFGQKASADTTQRQLDFDNRVDSFFDGIEGVPQFGQTGTLTRSQETARKQCYGMAVVLKSSGGTFEDNLGKAVKAYKGLHGIGDKPEDTLRRKLDKNKKRFTARPGGQKTKPKYKNEDEKVMQAMTEKGREMGLEW